MNAAADISAMTITNGHGAYGGINNYRGTLTLNNSTVSDNNAVDSGGGIRNDSSATLHLNHSTITDNAAGSSEGIYNNMATINFQSSIVAGNNNNNDCDTNGGMYLLNISGRPDRFFKDTHAKQEVLMKPVRS